MRLYADKFLGVMNALAGIRHLLQSYPPGTQGTVMVENIEIFDQGLPHLAELFDQMDMPLSKRHIGTILNAKNLGQQYQISDLINVINIIYASVHGELDGRLFLGIHPSSAKYYSSPEAIFGSDVLAKFPSISYEIDEAAKCLALERHTASVFHLMRVMERCIFAIRMCLGLPDPVKLGDRNWGTILSRIKDEMERRNKSVPPQWLISKDRSLFDDLYASLVAVKNAWRDPTMHVENMYVEENAAHILLTVKALTKKIASRMDENGLPPA